MNTEHILEDLRTLARQVREWDCEDVCKMYDWMIQSNLIAWTLNDDALFTSIIQPDNLPVGSSPAPHDLTNVWTWDNHGRYLVGKRWTANELKSRRLDELNVV